MHFLSSRTVRVAATVALLFVGVATVVLPSLQQLHPDGRDFASFHFAVQAWLGGVDPYDADVLTELARSQGVRQRSVYPFLYPSPALLLFVWAAPLELETAYHLMVGMGWLGLAGVLWSMASWFRAPGPLLAALFATCGPLITSARLGQVNTLVLLAVIFGVAGPKVLRRASDASTETREPLGVGLALAALVKMSPALLALPWLIQRRVRPLLGLALSAGLFTALALAFVPWETHLRFATEILPQFATGAPDQLGVPLQFSGNHSWLALYDRFWPGPDDSTLSDTALTLGRLTTLGLLVPLAALSRRRRDDLGEAALVGAFVVVMTLTPAFAWEHHLVFLLLPAAAVGTGLLRGRLPRWAWAPALLAWTPLAIPSPTLRRVARQLGSEGWLLLDSKTVAAVVLGGLSAWLAWRSRQR